MKKKSAKKGAAKTSQSDFFRLRLYIAGQTPNSIAAIANLKKICEDKLKGKYRIEVVDLLGSRSWPRVIRSSPFQLW